MADESNHAILEAQLALFVTQMNENCERLQTLEAENKVVRVENKELQTKIELLTTSITSPPGFGHAYVDIGNVVVWISC
ncbi:hypothetical protein ACOSP7_028344 [Xanthoceras sorbifolium]